MNERTTLSWVHRQWRRTAANGRLSIGAFVVVLFCLAGLSPPELFGIVVTWPLVLLSAAVGWSRIGLSVRPMLMLVVLGIVQDIAVASPFGSYAVIALITYGIHAAASTTFDLDNDPVLSRLLPFGSLGVAMICLWVIASNAAGMTISPWPLIWLWMSTTASYLILHPLFNLRSRLVGSRGGS